jgi:DDE family transposase
MPVRIVLSQGQSSDKTIAPTLIEGLKPDRDLVADRGYDARAIIDLVEARGGRAH